MKYNVSTLLLVLVVVTANATAQTESAPTSNPNLELPDCTVVLIRDVDLPALESGQIRDVLVKPGDNVLENALVAQMDDSRSQHALRDANLRFDIADKRANDTFEVDAALKRYQLAYDEHKKMAKLKRSGSKSEYEAERARVSAELANLEFNSAQKNKKLAATEAEVEKVAVQAATDSIARHAMKAPMNGVVYEVNKEMGEWVTAGETVMKIAQMDRLRISTSVDGNRYNPHQISDRTVTVTLTLPGNQPATFEGQVVYVAGSRGLRNEFMVWAEVENRTHNNDGQHWILNPGSTVDMTIHLNKPVLQSAATTNIKLGNK